MERLNLQIQKLNELDKINPKFQLFKEKKEQIEDINFFVLLGNTSKHFIIENNLEENYKINNQN